MAAAQRYDVVVIGSGIAGATVGAILARQGRRVALLDGARHPRFALGESTIGETSYLLRLLAERYDVPELANVSTATGIAEHVSAGCGIKRNFGFAWHEAGRAHDPAETTQCNVTERPFGPESHLLRADVDAYLFRAAVAYGAEAHEEVRVAAVDVDADGATVTLADGRAFVADYVIDASGRTSVLASTFGLREEPARFKTHSRTLFTHMEGVRPFDDCTPSSGQPTPWHAGTLHHMFDGGWMWVIPFDNHEGSANPLVSVGLSLDSQRFPRPEGVSAAQEWEAFLAEHPTIAAQFADARPVFDWISTGRTQFSSSRTVGDRWCLMSHAAGAIDALFSRGMANTVQVIWALVPELLAAFDDGDFSAARFAPIDALNQGLLDFNDDLVHGSYVAFRDFDLWRAWSKVWFLAWNLGVARIAGTYWRYTERGDDAVFGDLVVGRNAGSFCPELDEFQLLFADLVDVIESVEAGELAPAEAVTRISGLFRDAESWLPAPLNLADVLRRWHDGSLDAQRALHAWGREQAPEALRRFYDYDPATVAAAAARYDAELANR